MPAKGLRPMADQSMAPRGGRTTKPAPPAQSARTHTVMKTIMIFRSAPFAFARPRRATWKRPEASATPTPSIQVRVRPMAEVPVKLVTKLVNMRIKPSLVSRLTTSTVSPVTGFTALTLKKEQIAEARTTIIQSEINNSIGLGILFPKTSTPRKNRSNNPFFLTSISIDG